MAKRNTYGGFKGGWGKLIVGNHDTPFKRVLTKWDPFNETVGEGRFVFGEDGAGYGVGSKAKDYNQRAQNYIQYTSPDFGGANLIVGHSSDAQNADDKGDNNENSLTSVGVEYASGDWEVKVAYETESNEALDDDSTGFRGSVAWEPSSFALGFFGESLDDATLGERTGYGVFAGSRSAGPAR